MNNISKIIAIFTTLFLMLSLCQISFSEEPHHKESSEDKFTGPFIVQVIGFVILALILVKFVFPFIGSALEKRRNSIQQAYDAVDRDKREIQQLTDDYQRKINNLQKETEKIKQEAIEEGKKMQEEIIREAEKIASEILNRVEREIHLQKESLYIELREKIIILSIEEARKYLEKNFSETDNLSYLEKSFKEIERLKIERTYA